MKTKKLKTVIALLLTVGTLISMCACGNSTPDTETTDTKKQTSEKEENEPTTLSEYLNDNNPVIFYKVKSIDKDENPELYVFEDDKVLVIRTQYIQKNLGELAKMSDDEILEVIDDAKKNYKERMAKKYDTVIQWLEEGKYGLQFDGEYESYEACGMLKIEWEEEREYEKTYRTDISDEEAKGYLEILKEWKPKGPIKSPYTLNVITDSSGNYTTSEELLIVTERDECEISCNSADEWEWIDTVSILETPSFDSDRISLENAEICGTIYDSFYSGWKCGKNSVFITRAKSDLKGLLLDTPKSENIEIDKDASELREQLEKEALADEDNQ